MAFGRALLGLVTSSFGLPSVTATGSVAGQIANLKGCRAWKRILLPHLRDRDHSRVLVESHVASPGAREKDFVSWGACLGDMESSMELRHLRYFIAVAEEGSLTLAAEKRLHTAQPSLSRQIRDQERLRMMPGSIRRSICTACSRVQCE
jgi:hypothetical protein